MKRSLLPFLFLCLPALASSLRLALPEPVTAGSHRNDMLRDTMTFWIRAFLTPDAVISTSAKEIVIPADSLPPDVQRTLTKLQAEPDARRVFVGLRRLLEQPSIPGPGAYNRERHRRHSKFVLPDTVAALEARTGFRKGKWRKRVIRNSFVKGRTRVLFRGVGITPRMSIAVTHDSRSGDESAPMLETEVILEREDGSGDWDFYVYGPDGKLAQRSHFATARSRRTGELRYRSAGVVPHVCMACHYDSNRHTFARLPLSFLGPED